MKSTASQNHKHRICTIYLSGNTSSKDVSFEIARNEIHRLYNTTKTILGKNVSYVLNG
jgi:hypothetical protein